MWLVGKYKNGELEIFKNSLAKELGDKPIFFTPKIKYQKYYKNKLKTFEENILEGYILCYHDKFKDSSIVNNIQYVKGLQYFLKNFAQHQNEIKNFILYCKNHQDNNGYLNQDFFNFSQVKQGRFLSGPFTNLIFKVLENKKRKLKVLIGDITTTIPKKNYYLYCSA
jgi:hypothetical protein